MPPCAIRSRLTTDRVDDAKNEQHRCLACQMGFRLGETLGATPVGGSTK